MKFTLAIAALLGSISLEETKALQVQAFKPHHKQVVEGSHNKKKSLA